VAAKPGDIALMSSGRPSMKNKKQETAILKWEAVDRLFYLLSRQAVNLIQNMIPEVIMATAQSKSVVITFPDALLHLKTSLLYTI